MESVIVPQYALTGMHSADVCPMSNKARWLVPKMVKNGYKSDFAN
jgi:hypothetical protein